MIVLDPSRRLGRLFYCLISMVVILALPLHAAEPNKTTVSDTLYRADGTTARGTLLISWPAFSTADGKTVAAGTLSVKIGSNGSVNIPLIPTQGATPAGTAYKVVISLDDGPSSTEYWAVPTLSPTTIAAIRSAQLPATVAMQVVSRDYVDQQLATAVRKSGDETISGSKSFDSSPLVPDPGTNAAAASKGYVDAAIAAAAPSASNVLSINRGGTGTNSFAPARCVRVADDGTKLESADTDCGSANADTVDGLHASELSNATQLQGTAVDSAPPQRGQQPYFDAAENKIKWRSAAELDLRDYGVKCDNATDDGPAINSAIASLDAVGGGTLVFPTRARCKVATAINLDNTTNFMLAGSGGERYPNPAWYTTTLICTMTSGACVSARSSSGFRLRNVELTWGNDSASGTRYLLDLSHSAAGTDSGGFYIADATFSGFNQAVTGQSRGINLNQAISGAVTRSQFWFLELAINGNDPASASTNAITVSNSTFAALGTTGIYEPNQGWVIEGNTFEGCRATSDGAVGWVNTVPCAVQVRDAGGAGVEYRGNWHGDAYGFGVWVDLGKPPNGAAEFSVVDNFFGGSSFSWSAQALARAANLTTFDTGASKYYLRPGTRITITNCSDTTFNGVFAVENMVSATQSDWANSGANATATGCSVTAMQSAVGLHPSTANVTGNLFSGINGVAVWSANLSTLYMPLLSNNFYASSSPLAYRAGVLNQYVGPEPGGAGESHYTNTAWKYVWGAVAASEGPSTLDLRGETFIGGFGKPGLNLGRAGNRGTAPAGGSADGDKLLLQSNNVGIGSNSGDIRMFTSANSKGVYVGVADANTANPGSGSGWTQGAGMKANGQLVSNTAAGTAPLAVSSTTVVANLNADMVDGQHASAFPANAAQVVAMFGSGSCSGYLKSDGTCSTPAGATITAINGKLSANVPLGTHATFYDGPSVSLTAGSWFLSGYVTISNASSSQAFLCKLWDGSTVTGSAQQTIAAPGSSDNVRVIHISGVATPSGAATWKISCAAGSYDSGSTAMLAAMTAYSTGTNASQLTALRLQ